MPEIKSHYKEVLAVDFRNKDPAYDMQHRLCFITVSLLAKHLYCIFGFVPNIGQAPNNFYGTVIVSKFYRKSTEKYWQRNDQNVMQLLNVYTK